MRVDVDRRALWTRVGAFSGGNQQKIAIAKWLLAESRVLLLYDPTRGVDVGTKNELYRLIRAYADAGGAVLFYSTEIPELVHLADRAIVFYAGACRRRDSRRPTLRGRNSSRRAGPEAQREGGVTMVSAPTRSAGASPPPSPWKRLARQRGLAIAIGFFSLSSRSSRTSAPCGSATTTSLKWRRAARRWRLPPSGRRSSCCLEVSISPPAR